jgi:hypothetical protein
MAESCPLADARARKTYSVILQALASVGQARVATAIGKSEATVSRMKDGDLQTFAALLTTIGLKPVPVENVCYKPEHLAHLQYFASIGMRHAQSEDKLFDDAE